MAKIQTKHALSAFLEVELMKKERFDRYEIFVLLEKFEKRNHTSHEEAIPALMGTNDGSQDTTKEVGDNIKHPSDLLNSGKKRWGSAGDPALQSSKFSFEGRIFTETGGKVKAMVGTFKDDELDEKLDYLKEAFARKDVIKVELEKSK